MDGPNLAQFKGFAPVRAALCNAVETNSIETEVRIYEEGQWSSGSSLDIRRTLIARWDLRSFVKESGIECEFFATPSSELKSDRSSSFFAPRLEAANAAWAAVTGDPARLRGKSPKAAIRQWLVEHAAEHDLLNRDGTPNQTGIEEICKVANWRPKGGATPTALAAPVHTPAVEAKAESRLAFASDLEDECPF